MGDSRSAWRDRLGVKRSRGHSPGNQNGTVGFFSIACRVSRIGILGPGWSPADPCASGRSDWSCGKCMIDRNRAGAMFRPTGEARHPASGLAREVSARWTKGGDAVTNTGVRMRVVDADGHYHEPVNGLEDDRCQRLSSLRFPPAPRPLADRRPGPRSAATLGRHPSGALGNRPLRSARAGRPLRTSL